MNQHLAKLRQRKIAYFTPAQIGPYHLARFKRLVEIFPKAMVIGVPGLSLPRPWTFDPSFLGPHLTMLPNGNQWAVTQASLRWLNIQKPEVIITAGYHPISQCAIAWWGKRNRVAVILHADTWQGAGTRRPWKEFFKKYLVVRLLFDAAFVPGYRGQEYLASLGLPDKYIWRGVYVVDNDHFAQGADTARQHPVEYRSRYGLPEDYFLCACRLSKEKNLHKLIKAFARYQSQGGPWHLVLVGTGPEEMALRRLAGSLSAAHVHFAGWQQYNALPVYYGLARAFILPSTQEPWGLVVNEAMACGLPVLVSRRCGCIPELCHRGINGFDFDPYDVEELGRLMLKMSSGEVDLEAMGEASRRIIANYTLDTWVEALTDCIETTVERVREKKSFRK